MALYTIHMLPSDDVRRGHFGASEHGLLVPAHRINAKSYLPTALHRESRILWQTVMSKHTTQWLKDDLEEGNVRALDIRVLTLAPDTSEDVIEAIARHIDEPARGVCSQVKEAWDAWSQLSIICPRLRVRAYRSIPTFQAVFVDECEAMIEILSFGSHPDQRVGLFLERAVSSSCFDVLWTSAVTLWEQGHPTTRSSPQARIH
jgi:hypothetical protein